MLALRAGSYHPARANRTITAQEDGMTAYDSRTGIEALGPPPLWVCALLGIVLIAAGIFALTDVAFATIISVKLIGLTAIAAGAFEIMHAFWTKGWGGFLWQVLLGALYLTFGLVLLVQPASGALVLTYFLGALLIASGAIRCLLSFAHWRQNGWMMLIRSYFPLARAALAASLVAVSAQAMPFSPHDSQLTVPDVALVAAECPAGYTLHPRLHRCVTAPTCPPGSTLHPQLHRCVTP
jgi:uncharacterized membrane protein HdeD (DUF308 family)